MDKNSVNKLLKALGENTKLKKNLFSNYIAFHGVGKAYSKRWLANIVPCDLLKLSVKEAIEIIATLSEGGIFYEQFPNYINTPIYGDKWGRLANYIEINDRAIAVMDNGCTCKGILNCIKLLPAIPPSAKSWANCIILSQIWQNIYGDAYEKGPFEENSIYGLRLNTSYSDNIIDYSIADKISPEEQLKAFVDLAHFRGIKVGFRHVISADQIKIARAQSDDETFNWQNPEHIEIYINECVKLMNLGFECMFIDSAKHIGGYDMANYTGVGALPEYSQMQYILNEIRLRSGKTNISFVGEKSSDDFERYRFMGLNAGTDFITGDNFQAVKELSKRLRFFRDYAPGVEVSNDNNIGNLSSEQKLNRINSAIFGYYLASDKLPSFMQMDDIFPLRSDTSTHNLMMTNPSYSTDGTALSHYENLFAKDEGRSYNKKVGELFAYALAN
mgnify:CR=1 FL=1